MNQRIPHTEPITNSYAAAYGYMYDGFAQAPIQYQVSYDGNYDEIKDDLWTMMQRGFTCSGIEANNVWMDENFPIIDDNIALDNVESDQYFYHTDHLGSSSWITDASGDVNQYLAYMPFGESFIDQRNGNDIRFKFTGKERDAETGFDYFGARYYASDLSIWLSVDPLASKYPGISPYMYVRGNPIMLVDRWGLEGEPITSKRLSFGKRAGNWFKGDDWKNHANKNIVKNNLYDLSVNKDGSISAKGSTHWNGKNSKGGVSGVNDVDYVFSKSGYDKTIHNSATSKDEKNFTRWKTIIPGMYNNSLDNFAFQMRELSRKTNPDYATNGGHMPVFIKYAVEFNPIISITNATHKIIYGKDIYGEKISEGQRFIAAPLSIIVKTPKVGKALKMDVLMDWIFNTTLDEATK